MMGGIRRIWPARRDKQINGNIAYACAKCADAMRDLIVNYFHIAGSTERL